MTRILRLASLALFVTLVQCKHTPPLQKSCDPAALAKSFSSKELRDVLNTQSYALISADRNSMRDSCKTTDDQLLERSCRLAENLHALGLEFTVARGHYGDNDGETSFLVRAPKDMQPALLYLGRCYNQDSVIVGDAGKHALVFTTGAYQGKAYSMDWQYSEQQNISGGHTDIKDKDGKEFKFSLSFVDQFDFSNNRPKENKPLPAKYEDAEKAFNEAFEVPKALVSQLYCVNK
ncbi:MAG TPA: hypothetical protein VK539_22180 [Myxococcaceae bacterium]|nr:hypothetical protein [Myxococcaceae bacterium]